MLFRSRPQSLLPRDHRGRCVEPILYARRCVLSAIIHTVALTPLLKQLSPADNALVEWANSHLSASLQVEDPTGSFFGGLAILRLAESIKGRPSSPPVPDSAFPTGPMDDKLDGLFRLFDFLLDNDVKMGSVSINDIRQGKRDKILQLLKALKSWDDKRRALAQTMNGTLNPSGGGAFLMPTGMQWASM